MLPFTPRGSVCAAEPEARVQHARDVLRAGCRAGGGAVQHGPDQRPAVPDRLEQQAVPGCTPHPPPAAEIKAAHPEIGVLLLSQHVETAHTVDLVARGGFGYLLKDRVLDVADFLAAVDRVARGGSALDPYVVGQLMHRTDGRHGLKDLTEREHDVLRMMAQGYTNAGVARRLFLSERTVEAHVRRLLAKLDIADTEDAHRRVLAVLTYLRTA